MKGVSLTIIVTVLCLTLLEGYALYQNVNGWYFSLVVAAIAAVTGNRVKDFLDLLKGGRNGKESNH